jgi:hypothetical protein
MLVCAIVEPTFDPVHDGDEFPIIAKGVADANGPNIGWALVQSHESFLFNYQVQESVVTTNTHTSLAFSPTHFAGGNSDLVGLGVSATKSPLNPSYIVVCGGRDGNMTRLALNHVYEAFGENDLTGSTGRP